MALKFLYFLIQKCFRLILKFVESYEFIGILSGAIAACTRPLHLYLDDNESAVYLELRLESGVLILQLLLLFRDLNTLA